MLQRQVDAWLVGLLPDSNIMLSDSNGSGINNMSSSSNGGSDNISTGLTVFPPHTKAWSSALHDLSTSQVATPVPTGVMSYYVENLLPKHLASISALQTRASCLCSMLSLLPQSTSYQPSQQLLNELEVLLEVPHATAESNMDVDPTHPLASPTMSNSKRERNVVVSLTSFAADLPPSQLHILMSFLHGCKEYHPSVLMMLALTARVEVASVDMELGMLVDLTYIMESWEMKTSATLQHQLMLHFGTTSSLRTRGYDDHRTLVEQASVSGLLRTLQPLQQLRLVWLLLQALGRTDTVTLLLRDPAAWNALFETTLGSLQHMSAEHVLDLGCLLSQWVPSADSSTHEGRLGMKLFLSAYAVSASSVSRTIGVQKQAQVSRITETILQLEGLYKASST